MIAIGKINKLKVLRKEIPGIYLEGDEEHGDILLPNKHIPDGLNIDDEIDVFIYFDSEDRIIATTLKPFAMVGEFAALEVASIEEFGLFLRWGLEKQLFVPFGEQFFEMLPGHKYVVYIYIDKSGRIAASTRINKFIDKSASPYSEGDAVELLLYQKTDMGIKAIINGRYDGLIFRDDIVNNLQLGQKLTGYVRKIRDDNKIDLSLRQEDGSSRNELADLILAQLNSSGGFLEINAKTHASVINSTFGVSRKKFKIALGYLYKKKLVIVDDSGIKLVKPTRSDLL